MEYGILKVDAPVPVCILRAEKGHTRDQNGQDQDQADDVFVY